MDLVTVAESVAKSPYGLPLFLLVVVWYTASVIKQKDMYMELHIKEDLEKADAREKWYRSVLEWYQSYLESNTERMTNIDNNIHDIENSIHDIESILQEGRNHFVSDSRDNENPPNPSNSSNNMRNTRRKLPK